MKTNFKIRDVVTGVVLSIFLAVYNILYYVIPFNREFSAASLWITYISTIVSAVIAFISVIFGLKDGKLKSRIFGIPIVYLCVFILLLQFILDCVVMTVGSFFVVQWWVSVVAETFLFSFFSISLISRKTYKSMIKEIDGREKDTLFIKDLRIRSGVLLRGAKGTSIENAMENLYECIRYTTPISNAETYDIEEEISEKVRRLEEYISDGNFVKAKKEIEITVGLINERKSILMKQR